MLGKSLRLFRLFGIDVKIDGTWVVAAALITWSLATGFFPVFYRGLSPGLYWAMGFCGTLSLFASLLLHELSHSLVGRRCGIPVHGITLFLFGGIAELDDEPLTAKAELVTSAVGPLASFVLGIAFYTAGYYWEYALPAAARGVIFYLGLVNIVLAIFNCFPAFPLDGGRVFRALLWHVTGDLALATRSAAVLGILIGWAFFALGAAFTLVGQWVAGLWWLLIGSFVTTAARISRDRTLARLAKAVVPGAAPDGEPENRLSA